MVNELEAGIVVAVAATAGPMVASKRRLLTEEDNITDKVPLKVMSITLYFASLPQEEIIWIFYIKFKSINF